MEAVFIRDGRALNYTPAAAVDAGDVVPFGTGLAVIKRDIAAGALGALHVEGEYGLVKDGTSGPVFAFGEPVFFDLATRLAVKTGGTLFGFCTADAGTDDAVVNAQLAPQGLPGYLLDKPFEGFALAGGSKTLDAEDSGKVMVATSGSDTNVFTLPATAAGIQLVVMAGVAGQRIALSPNASDKFLGPDLTGTDNKDIILTGATAKVGDYIVLEYGGADGWMIRAKRGIWTHEA